MNGPGFEFSGYHFMSRLGQGGMATVYLARQESVDRLVALKVMDRAHSDTPGFVERFLREAHIAANLTHPHIVPIYDYKQTDGHFWLSMAFLTGGNLRERLKKGPLDLTKALSVARQIADALGAAHARNVIHRDLKPDNILLQGDHAFLADFGIAKMLNATVQLTRTGESAPVTVPYMAPEQVANRPVDGRTDLYALGVVLQQMLTGELPHDADNLAALMYHIHNEPPRTLPTRLAGLRPLMNVLLAKPPEHRLASAAELSTVLAELEHRTRGGVPVRELLSGIELQPSGRSAPDRDADATNEGMGAEAAVETVPNPRRSERSSLSEVSEPPLAPDPGVSPNPTLPTAASGLEGPQHVGGVPSGGSTRGAKRAAVRPTIDVVDDSLEQVRSEASTETLQVVPGDSGATPAGTRLDGQPEGNYNYAGGTDEKSAQWPRWAALTFGLTALLAGFGALVWFIIPRTGEIQVTSTPPGASVLLDGKDAGQTPLDVDRLPPADYRVEVSLVGHAPWIAEAQSVKAGESLQLQANLVALQADVNISTEPDGAWVEVDGWRIPGDTTPTSIGPLAFGRHELRLGKVGYEPASRTVDIDGDTPVDVGLDLFPLPSAELALVREPASAAVSFTGSALRYADGMRLRPGDHELTVSAPGYFPRTVQLSLAEGRNEERVELLPKPDMVRIEKGCYQMGSLPDEAGRDDDERQHEECLKEDFVMARHELTVGEFRRFVDATSHRTDAERNTGGQGCATYEDGQWEYREGRSWRDPGFTQDEDHPVVCVSWNDAQAYATWLSRETGRRYRLPTEAQWEYVARAGTTTPFWTGRCVSTRQVNYDGNFDHDGCGAKTGQYRRQTVSAGSLPANAWGLHEVLGNVWEWTCSEYDEGYSGGEAHCATGAAGGSRAQRGGSWYLKPGGVRSAARNRNKPATNFNVLGFRLAQD